MYEGLPEEIYCRHCGNLMHLSTEVCPYCGVRNQYAQAPASGGGTPLRPEHGVATTAQAIRGLKDGVYAALSGLVLTSLLFFVSVLNNSGDLPEMIKSIPAVSAAVAGDAVLNSPLMAAVKFMVWVFYGANHVSVHASAAAGDTTRETSSNVVSALGASSGLEPTLFHAIPVVLLVLFGYRAARSRGYWEIHENVAAGASVTVGYAAFALVGALFASIGFGAEAGPNASVGPRLGQSLLAFVVLACVCGGLGGLVRHVIEEG